MAYWSKFLTHQVSIEGENGDLRSTTVRILSISTFLAMIIPNDVSKKI